MRPSADHARADAPSTHTTPRTDRGPTHTTPRRAGADDDRAQAASAHTTPRSAGADDDRDRAHAGTTPRRTRTDDAGTDSTHTTRADDRADARPTHTTPSTSADDRADARPTHTTPSNSADDRADARPTHTTPSNSADDDRADARPTHTTPSNSADDAGTDSTHTTRADDRADARPTHTTPSNSADDAGTDSTHTTRADDRADARPTHTTPRNSADDDRADARPTHTTPSNSADDDCADARPTHTTPSNSADDDRADARPTHTTPSNSADGTDSTCTTNVCARSIPRLLAASAFALLCLADPLSARAQTVDHVLTATGEVHDVATLAAPEGERTLLATSGGLVVLDAELRPLRTLTTRDGLSGARLRSVSVTSDAIWLGGVEGLVRLDHHLRPTLARPERRVRRVVEWDGHTWIASYGEGLFRDGEPVDTGRSHARRRLTDLVVRRVRDTEELWVATAGAGILRLAPDGRLLGRLVRHHGLPDDLVWDLEPSADALFVATARGIARVEGDAVVRRAAVTRAGLRVPDVRHVHVAGDTLYAATYGGGLHRFDGARFRVLGPRDLRARSSAPAI